MRKIFNKKRAVFSGGLFLALFWVESSLASEKLYRYKDKSGDVVIDHRVPPEFVGDGYEVLSSTGRILEVVPPHRVVLVEEKEQKQQATSHNQGVEEQKNEDSYLLRSYSALSDLETARDRRLELLDREIKIVESNLDKSREQLEVSRSKAANYQRSGNVVPKILLDNITNLSGQVKNAEQMSQVREKERQLVSEKYERYIQRFIVLRGAGSGDGKNQPSKLAIDPASAQSVGG